MTTAAAAPTRRGEVVEHVIGVVRVRCSTPGGRGSPEGAGGHRVATESGPTGSEGKEWGIVRGTTGAPPGPAGEDRPGAGDGASRSGNVGTDSHVEEGVDTEGDDVRDAGLPPEPGATGNAEVDAVLGRLARAAGNVGVYEDVHQSLRGILAALDPPPGPTPNRS